MLLYVLYWYVNIDMKVVLVGFWVGSCVQVAPPVMIRAVAEAGCTIVTMITYHELALCREPTVLADCAY